MLIFAYCLVSVSLFKIIVDLANANLVAPFSIILDNVIVLIVLALVIRIAYLQKQGKREQLKDRLSQLEKDIEEVKEQ